MVISDSSLSAVPTLEWQDRLCNRLASALTLSPIIDPIASSPKTYDISGSPVSQRRRLSSHFAGNGEEQPEWGEMYTMDTLSGEHGQIPIHRPVMESSTLQTQKNLTPVQIPLGE
jgi:hypothetical protein